MNITLLRNISSVIPVLVILAALIAPARADPAHPTAEFFRSGESATQTNSDQIFPLGRLMPLSLFSLPDEDLAKAKESGFTMTGPYYGKEPQNHYPAARTHGLKVFCAIGGDRDDLGLPIKGDGSPISVEELKARVTAQINAVLDDPDTNQQVAWWYLKPEELRHWKAPEMDHLRIVAETARELDPQKRPVWMYEPNHRNASELANTGKFLDVIGKGCYVNGKDRPIQHVWIRWSIEQEVQAAANLLKSGNETQPVPIAVLEMSRDPDDESEFSEIPKWLRHDIYLSLVCGAKGITIWSGAPRNGLEKTRQIHLDTYFDTIKEITKTHGLDQVFLFGQRRSDLQVKVTKGPPTLDLQIEKGKEFETMQYPSVAFLDVAHNGSRYLILVNSSEQPVTVNVSGLPEDRVHGHDLLRGKEAVISGGSFPAPLQGLGVRVFKLDP